MKNIGIKISVLALVALGGIAGCTSTPVEEFVGKAAIANGALFRQAESIVIEDDKEAAPECKQRKISHRTLVKAPEVVVTAHGGYESVPFSGSGTPSSYVVPSGARYSKFVERWTIQRCDTNVNYLVTYTPDGPNGPGTTVTAELEK